MVDSLAGEVRRHDRDRFVTALTAPSARRESLFALYAFNHELATIGARVREPLLGEMRLQWWREAVARLAAGGDLAHPVARGLAAALAAHRLSVSHLERLIDARATDLNRGPLAERSVLFAYAEGTAAPLVALALEVLEVRGEAALAAARSAGTAWALTGILRAVPFHAAEGRIVLPADLLAEHDVDGDDLLAGRPGPRLAEIAELVAGLALTEIAAARRLAPDLPKQAAPALLVTALAEAYLARLRGARHDLMDTSWSAVRPPVLRLWWRARRGSY